MRVLKTLLSIIFPTYCAGCGTESVSACTSCISRARLAPPADDPFCISLFSYQDPVIRQAVDVLPQHQALIPHLFHPLKEASLPLVSALALFSEESLVLILPVPASRSLKNKYKNTLAQTASRILGYPAISGVLTRSRKHPETVSVTNQAVIHNAICILVDDVMRTGATIKNTRAALLAAGAREVYALTIAR